LDPGRDGKEVDGRQVDQFTEKTGMARVTQKANVRAHIVATTQTKLAVIAIKRWLKCPAVSRSESTNTGPRFYDLSCRLVSEYHRVDIRSAADTALAVGMQIGPADAYSLNPDLDLSRSRIFNRYVGKPDPAGSDEFRSLHRILFLQNNTLSVGETEGERGTSQRHIPVWSAS